MYLQSGNVVIRSATAADCMQLAAWWNDGSVMAHAGFPLGLGITPEEIEAELGTDSDDSRRRLILETNGISIGEMSYTRISEGTAELGIKICESSYQEKGLGRRYLSMLIDALFNSNYHRIVLDTDLKNTRAQHVYELLGFRRLRVNLDTWTDQLGEAQSSVDYELQAEGWRGANRELLLMECSKNALETPAMSALLAYSQYMPTEQALKELAHTLRRDTQLYAFSAVADGSPVGLIVLRQKETGVGEVRSIAVVPSCRRQGIASKLVHFAADRLSCKEVCAETDDEAVEFYHRLGFQITSLGEKYPGVVRYQCLLNCR